MMPGLQQGARTPPRSPAMANPERDRPSGARGFTQTPHGHCASIMSGGRIGRLPPSTLGHARGYGGDVVPVEPAEYRYVVLMNRSSSKEACRRWVMDRR